uniref:Leucine-rich repeat-containing protein 57 n=1 Tax=Parastrongyloides trichosuri TaxID=131310 RepID=A0A0N4ZAE1_PARTI
MGGESSKNKQTTKSNAISNIKKGGNTNKSFGDIDNYIATSKKTRILNIKNLKLKGLPERTIEVAEFLKVMDASQNLITFIPTCIGKFTNLKQLTLNQNAINEIPEEIGLCQNLTKLELSGNKLNYLPDNIKMLHKLTTINLSKNSFTVFPIVLCSLVNLEVIDISENDITELPEEVENLNCLELNLSFNKLEKLHDNLAKCTKLKLLRVNNNNLTLESFTKSLLSDSKIVKIDIDSNRFSEKDFQSLPGYDSYEQRYTANRMKI